MKSLILETHIHDKLIFYLIQKIYNHQLLIPWMLDTCTIYDAT